MRVSLIGQAAFGEAVLKRLIEEGAEIVAASAPEPREGAQKGTHVYTMGIAPTGRWTASTDTGSRSTVWGRTSSSRRPRTALRASGRC